MKASISKDGKTMTIEIEVNQVATESGSGKSFLVASTNGNAATDLEVEIKDDKGKVVKKGTVTIGLNAYVKK